MTHTISIHTFAIALFLFHTKLASSWISPIVSFSCPLKAQHQLFSTKRQEEAEDLEEADTWDFDDLEVLQGEGDDFYGDDNEEDWIPDGEIARRKPKITHLTPANEVIFTKEDDVKQTGAKTESQDVKKPASPYTEEEEELINAMGGKDRSSEVSKREIGFLGERILFFPLSSLLGCADNPVVQETVPWLRLRPIIPFQLATWQMFCVCGASPSQ